MKLYYRENGVLKCEDIEDEQEYFDNDRVAIFIDKSKHEAIIICAYGDLSYFNASGLVESGYDCCSDYSHMLSELLEQHTHDFNEEAINLVIGRVERSYNAYIEAYKYVKRLVIQPDTKSAHNF